MRPPTTSKWRSQENVGGRQLYSEKNVGARKKKLAAANCVNLAIARNRWRAPTFHRENWVRPPKKLAPANFTQNPFKHPKLFHSSPISNIFHFQHFLSLSFLSITHTQILKPSLSFLFFSTTNTHSIQQSPKNPQSLTSSLLQSQPPASIPRS